MKVLGLMSGTSMDGLDCCYADISINKDYDLEYNIIDFETIKFKEEIYSLIKKTVGSHDNILLNNCSDKLGYVFLEIVKSFIKNNEFDLISMHGQTVRHLSKIESVQIGNPKNLYEYYKKPVVYNFREKDIFLGGNGAPLVPYLDWLLYKDSKINLITLNIGGIANVTLLPKKSKRDDVIGFDTGPGMCLIDSYVNLIWYKDYDVNGELSKKGKINSDILNYLINDKYVNRSYPKSISTEYYDINFLNSLLVKFPNNKTYTILRTLVHFTALSIYRNIEFFIKINNNYNLILSGGGIHNLILVSDLEELFDKNKIFKLNQFNNIDKDIKEGLLMAVMGYSKYNDLYNNMPSVTGASKYESYGVIYE
tara:strand:- start:244 stop:1341 length:1098 start_codon:yes stop_codon:yes gene_type:complete